MTLTGIRNGIVLIGVTLLAVMVADAAGFDPFDSDTDLAQDERAVQVRFYALSKNSMSPVRFDVDGGFTSGDTFHEDDKRDGYRKSGVSPKGTSAWGKMFLHVHSGDPKRMWCEVWQGNREITIAQHVWPDDAFDAAGISKLGFATYCAGTAR